MGMDSPFNQPPPPQVGSILGSSHAAAQSRSRDSRALPAAGRFFQMLHRLRSPTDAGLELLPGVAFRQRRPSPQHTYPNDPRKFGRPRLAGSGRTAGKRARSINFLRRRDCCASGRTSDLLRQVNHPTPPANHQKPPMKWHRRAPQNPVESENLACFFLGVFASSGQQMGRLPHATTRNAGRNEESLRECSIVAFKPSPLLSFPEIRLFRAHRGPFRPG
ncbi:MAG: hypothetical protein DKINENOH_04197 [bacterium]|nr:hypothetical protein [bacterium]